MALDWLVCTRKVHWQATYLLLNPGRAETSRICKALKGQNIRKQKIKSMINAQRLTHDKHAVRTFEESDTTEQLHFHFSLSCTGEGHGNPLQCSCLENPRDGGAWWAAVSGVAQSWTRLKRLSSSSSSTIINTFWWR